MKNFTSFPKYSETNIFFGQCKYFFTTTPFKHLITSLNKQQTESSVQVTLQNTKSPSKERVLDRYRKEIYTVHSLITPFALHKRKNRRESPGDKKSACWLYAAHVSCSAGSNAEVQVTDTAHSSAHNTVLPVGLFQPRAKELQAKQQEHI